MHATDFASECTLPFAIGFNQESCKLCAFKVFVLWSHDLPIMVLTSESDVNFQKNKHDQNLNPGY